MAQMTSTTATEDIELDDDHEEPGQAVLLAIEHALATVDPGRGDDVEITARVTTGSAFSRQYTVTVSRLHHTRTSRP